MGTITVNVTDETEEFFRRTVLSEFGKGKGILGRALDEAMKRWAEEKRQGEIAERQAALMRKGFKLGKLMYKKRSELYDRPSVSR